MTVSDESRKQGKLVEETDGQSLRFRFSICLQYL